MLEAAGSEGLVGMYQNLYGFGDPVIINYPDLEGQKSIIMYATIQHVIDTINNSMGESKGGESKN